MANWSVSLSYFQPLLLTHSLRRHWQTKDGVLEVAMLVTLLSG
jgi:hypothetical protein